MPLHPGISARAKVLRLHLKGTAIFLDIAANPERWTYIDANVDTPILRSLISSPTHRGR